MADYIRDLRQAKWGLGVNLHGSNPKRSMSALCQKQIYAVRKNSGYSITSSARASSDGDPNPDDCFDGITAGAKAGSGISACLPPPHRARPPPVCHPATGS
jgi:hypothetical protein